MDNDSRSLPARTVVAGMRPLELDVSFNQKALDVLAEARDYEIDSPEVRALADTTLANAKDLARRIEDARKATKAPYLEVSKKIDEFFGEVKAIADAAIKELQPKILIYDRAVAEERAKAQAAAEEAARKERERLQKEAEAAARAGNAAAADSLEMAAAMVQAPVIPLGPDKAETKTSHRTTWSAEVTDLMALVKAVASGAAPIEALEPNMTYLNGRARLEKAALKIDGVKPVGTESLASRRAA